MTKLAKLLANMMALLMLPAEQREDEKSRAVLAETKAFLESDEFKALDGNEWKSKLATMQKTIDDQATEIRNLQKLGLKRQGDAVRVMGKAEILDLMEIGKVFPSNERAMKFGATVIEAALSNRVNYKEMVCQGVRDIAADVRKEWSEQQKATMDPGVSGSGSEFIANAFIPDLIAPLEAAGKLYPLCQRVPLSTVGTTYYPKLTSDIDNAVPTAVMAALTEKALATGNVQMVPVKWGLIIVVPNEFLRNPMKLVDLGQLVGTMGVRAIANGWDDALVNGDGTARYGNIMGIRNDTNLTAVNPASATSVASYTGADVSSIAKGITKDTVTDPQFYFHLSVMRTFRAIRTTTGEAIFTRGSNGEPNMIDDYRYNICQKWPPAASAATASVKFGAFGDIRLSHVFGLLNQIEISQSEHVLFNSDATAIRFIGQAHAALRDANALVVLQTHS
ncbi:MAG: phage major capsid protein [Phycisphaerae bacterium]